MTILRTSCFYSPGMWWQVNRRLILYASTCNRWVSFPFIFSLLVMRIIVHIKLTPYRIKTVIFGMSFARSGLHLLTEVDAGGDRSACHLRVTSWFMCELDGQFDRDTGSVQGRRRDRWRAVQRSLRSVRAPRSSKCNPPTPVRTNEKESLWWQKVLLRLVRGWMNEFWILVKSDPCVGKITVIILLSVVGRVGVLQI
jgi:hypothetical protein